MELVARGLTNRDICTALGIQAGTVKNHLAAIYRELEVTNRTEAAAAWLAEQAFQADGTALAPNLIVFPFRAYSTDPEDEVLAGGVTEDVTSLLARIPGIVVIARGSAASIQSDVPNEEDVRVAAREFGVRYAAEGSVRRAAGSIRINVRLVEAATGGQLWAERWNRRLDELGDVEDALVAGLAGRLAHELALADERRVRTWRTEDLGAWELYQRAIVCFYYDGFNAMNTQRALDLVDEALERDPDFVHAHAFRAALLADRVTFHWEGEREPEVDAALRAGRRAVTMAPNDPFVLQHWGQTLSLIDDPASAIFPLHRSIQADPSNPQSWALLAQNYARTGRLEEADRHFERAFQLSPQDPRLYLWISYQVVAEIVRGDWDEVVSKCRQVVALRDDQALAWSVLATALARQGREEEARRAGTRASELRPGSAFDASRRLIVRYRSQDSIDDWRAIQEKAGLVDERVAHGRSGLRSSGDCS